MFKELIKILIARIPLNSRISIGALRADSSECCVRPSVPR